MRFLCDVHISYRVRNFLSEEHYCVHVNNILQGDKTKDKDIATYSNQENLILVTKDEDFVDSYLLKRLPAKLLKINLGNISTNELIKLIGETLPIIEKIKDDHHFLIEIHKNSIEIFEDYQT